MNTGAKLALLLGSDTTPGGSQDALMLEASADGFLLEDGSGVILME